MPLAVEVGHRLEQGLAAACAAIASPLDEHHHRLAMRRRVLEGLLLRAVAVQASDLAQWACCQLFNAFRLDDITIVIAHDLKCLEASELQEVGHSAPWANPH